MKRNATITLDFPSKALAEMVLDALQPETRKPATSRSTVHLFEDYPEKLTLRVEAKDTPAMRATVNSYLRWIALVTDIYDFTTRLEKAAAK